MRIRTRHLLLISLVINLFLTGILFGQVMRPPFPNHGKKGHWNMNSDALTKNLPKETADKISAQMKDLRKNKDVFEEMRDARAEVLKALTAEKFDKEAYQEKVDDLNDIRTDMMENFSNTISNIAADLTYEERKILAANLKDMERQRGKRWK